MVRAEFDHGGDLDAVLAFVKRTRSELRSLRAVRVWKDRMQILDVNKDAFEIRGLGYESREIVPVLRLINTAFDPAKIHRQRARSPKNSTPAAAMRGPRTG